MTRLDEAIRKLHQGKLEDGQRILQQLRRELPHHPAVLYNLGMCYSQQGKLQSSIELAPHYTNTYAALRFSYPRSGKPQKAVQVLQTARRQDPSSSDEKLSRTMLSELTDSCDTPQRITH